MAGLAAHRNDEIPARRRLGVDHQVLHDVDAVVPRGLEPERVHVRRQVEVVVDRLRHVDDANPAGRALFEVHRRERRVVAADGDELRDVEPKQRGHGVFEQSWVGRRIGARDAEVRSAAKVDAADGVDGERHDMRRVALHDPLEAVADPDDGDAFEAGADGGGADDAIDAGGRAAADQDGKIVRS